MGWIDLLLIIMLVGMGEIVYRVMWNFWRGR
jgi:hypothetical protein